MTLMLCLGKSQKIATENDIFNYFFTVLKMYSEITAFLHNFKGINQITLNKISTI